MAPHSATAASKRIFIVFSSSRFSRCHTGLSLQAIYVPFFGQTLKHGRRFRAFYELERPRTELTRRSKGLSLTL
jgi:hypothetical protein